MYGPKFWVLDLLEPYNFLRREFHFLAIWLVGSGIWVSGKIRFFSNQKILSIGLSSFANVSTFAWSGATRTDRLTLISGAYGGVGAAARSRKKLQYGEPVGNTASRGRARRVHYLQVAYDDTGVSSERRCRVSGDQAAIQGCQKSEKNCIWGVSGRNSGFRGSPRPGELAMANRMNEKRGAVARLSYYSSSSLSSML